MTDGGFVKLDRRILRWQWYKDLNTKALLIHLILTANWEDRSVEGVLVRRGQRLASLPELSGETGLSIQQLRTCVRKLEQEQALSHELRRSWGNGKTLYTICNYNVFQGDGAGDHFRAADRQPAGQPAVNRCSLLKKKKKNRIRNQRTAPPGGSESDAAEMDWRILEKELAEEKEE